MERIFVDQVFDGNIYKDIGRVNEAFLKADWICCIGMGSSGIIADYAARKLNTIGFKAISSNEPYAPILRRQINEPNNVLLLFSTSGETRELIELVRLLEPYQKTVISMTNSKENTLAKLSTINLSYYTAKQRLTYNFDLSSQIPVVALIEYLIAYCYNSQTAED
ncbi:helix-turn-helix domain, rpiR family protein [Listeria floridensis FSL S10-1187]|uniref:Helix-turn-helix domain, rpiR family protein n=1 Tax=Listeria floridensis FSL S10-1187 TaxID=1265817 RepID=A0ABN0RE61_9LIST|nr:MurR/RpiR family transcriptional regulator [Listeria floridensis]EUJ30743.1 helix-turn-helix domain, rpiR family protein [Listeria floridensis FSL S10-1187]